ncbi:hypothetical protein H4N48_09370 [Streptomyces sp. BSE7-9]|nr:hypothetical protein [Streptomyces sp. BSE7-9]
MADTPVPRARTDTRPVPEAPEPLRLRRRVPLPTGVASTAPGSGAVAAKHACLLPRGQARPGPGRGRWRVRPRPRPGASASGFRTARRLPDRCGRGRAAPSASGVGAGRGGCPTGRAASGASPCRTPAGSAAPPTAVEALSLGLTAAAFWWPGCAGGLTVSRPAAVPLRRRGRTGTLSVSDPTRTGEPQELEWGRPVRKVPDAAEILPTGPRPRLRVTRGEACATRV